MGYPIFLKNQKGVTLIEIMVVLAIIAAIIATAAPRLGNKNRALKSEVRKFSVLTRELHNRAKLKGLTYRLVIELIPEPTDKDADPAYNYWVESTSQRVLQSNNPDEEPEVDEDGNPIEPNGFSLDKSILKSKKQLPDGLIFESVEMTGLQDPIVNGRAYIHFLPEGLADEAAIHISFGDSISWTIVTHPLTGKSEVFGRNVRLEELKR